PPSVASLPEVGRAERVRQDLAQPPHGSFAGARFDRDGHVGAELVQHLPASATRGGGLVGARDDRDGVDRPLACVHGGGDRVALGAHGHGIRGVLDVRAREHLALGQDRGAHVEVRVRRVGSAFHRLTGRGQQLVDAFDRCAHSARTSCSSVVGSGCPSRVIRTFEIRRPLTLSAVNRRFWNETSSPSCGIEPMRPSISPPTVSHSSSGSSTSRSSFTSSIDNLPSTRNTSSATCSSSGSSVSYSSVISPTSSSSRSSSVMSPTTLPYSSVTSAMWNFSFCISRSRSATFLDSGTKCASRTTSVSGMSCLP